MELDEGLNILKYRINIVHPGVAASSVSKLEGGKGVKPNLAMQKSRKLLGSCNSNPSLMRKVDGSIS